MEIKVLGKGCSKCIELEKRIRNVLSEIGRTADVEKVTDIKAIMAFGILTTPGLVIDGRLKSAGRIPRSEEIKAWIQEAGS